MLERIFLCLACASLASPSLSHTASALTAEDVAGSYDGAYSTTCSDAGALTVVVTIEGLPMRAKIAMSARSFESIVAVRGDRVFMDFDFARREWLAEPTSKKLRLTTRYDFYSQRFRKNCSVTVWLDKES